MDAPRNRLRQWVIFLFLGFLLSCLAGVARAGEVKGRVEFAGPSPQEEWVAVRKNQEVCGPRRPLERLVLSPDGGVANVLVELEGVHPDSPKLPPRIAVLDNRDCQFLPRVQVAPVGTFLEIRNSDAILHTAHAYRKPDETLFHVALPHFREHVRVVLDRPGLLRLICDVGHVWMEAYILVTDNPFAAVTDSDGRFSLAGVRAGAYRLRIWHELLGILVRPITISDREAEPVVLRYPER